MKVEELAVMRTGAELQNLQPYMNSEIIGMQKAIVSFVLSAVNNGTLTPEIAMSKWVEYIAYQKLNQKISQRIRMGQDLGQKNAITLDIKG